MNIESLIMEIVESHSGGIKFTELITELVAMGYRPSSPEEVEEAVKGMSGLKILEYTWHAMNRTKMFVYTP